MACLPDDGKPFLVEPQSPRSYATTASTHHYAHIANVATAARCRIPSCTISHSNADRQPDYLTPYSLSHKPYFCTISLMLCSSLYFFLSHLLSIPIFVVYLSCSVPLSISFSPNYSLLILSLKIGFLPALVSSLYLEPYFSISTSTGSPPSSSTVSTKDVATMPLLRCGRREPRCCGRIDVATMTFSSLYTLSDTTF